jgi:hypothetical protein
MNIKCPHFLLVNWKLQITLLTELIPGILRIFPTTGTLLRKLTTTGRNPLKSNEDILWVQVELLTPFQIRTVTVIIRLFTYVAIAFS